MLMEYVRESLWREINRLNSLKTRDIDPGTLEVIDTSVAQLEGIVSLYSGDLAETIKGGIDENYSDIPEIGAPCCCVSGGPDFSGSGQ